MNWTFSRSAAPLSPWIRCWFSSGIGVGYRNKLLCKKFVSESIMCRTIVNHTSKTQTILWKSSLRLFPLLEYRGLIRRDIKVPITISVVMCVNYQDSVSGMKWEKMSSSGKQTPGVSLMWRNTMTEVPSSVFDHYFLILYQCSSFILMDINGLECQCPSPTCHTAPLSLCTHDSGCPWRSHSRKWSSLISNNKQLCDVNQVSPAGGLDPQ